MRYLAQIVERNRHARTVKLRFLACNPYDHAWVKTTKAPIAIASKYLDLEQGSLVVMELDEKDKITQAESSPEAIARTINQFLIKLAAIDNREAEIKVWRESLEIQTQELYQRSLQVSDQEKTLNNQKQLFKIRVDKIREFEKSLREKAAVVERERQALSDQIITNS